MAKEFVAIISIINTGYSDLVMESAKSAGARGGTIFSARGSGNNDIEKFFGVNITPEKDIVLILVKKDIQDKVLHAINEGAGMNTKGQGIAFSIPVEDTVGFDFQEASAGK
ncbi:MAG: P-II family nitrogen regulator [Bacilli bacterium]|nr:P-II family nitrogen regulator [Bacilli bacterium]MDY6430243.1 P-II family nitrogen regulator [Bacilli bacterium]